MDTNKLEKLREIKYQLRKSCGTCENASFPPLNDDWSTCKLHTYKHLKHSTDVRNLSINAYGYCDSFKWSRDFLSMLGAWEEFKEKR